MNVEVICIDDAARPNEVPTSRWVRKGNTYHIVKVMRMAQQGGIAGVKLAEINNDDLYPYTFFQARRFAIPVDLEELVRAGELEEETV